MPDLKTHSHFFLKRKTEQPLITDAISTRQGKRFLLFLVVYLSSLRDRK